MARPFTYGSVCSGIEAATVAWHPLGWQPAFFSEIEAFPRAVLTHHYPAVPCHGDFTTIGADEYGAIDLLVGGTPCQSFSVAGLRGGLADDRGNLTLEFLKLAARKKPEWIVWENVPGVLSDKTGALHAFLDGLEELGYIVDIDILDAQYFGVPQRRRRVFVCGQLASSLVQKKTISSVLTVAQCLVEMSLLASVGLNDRFNVDPESLAFDASQPFRSLRQRMTLFGLDCPGAAQTLHENLVVLRRLSEQGQSASASAPGKSNSASIGDTRSLGSINRTADRAAFPNIDRLSSATLADLLLMMSECITLTSSKTTTESKIYSFAQATLHTASLIIPSMASSPSFWSAASSTLTALKAFIDYARFASNDLFTDPEWLHPWRDFVGQAERTLKTLGDIGDGDCPGEVLPVADSLSWDSAPRRETGKGVAALTANGVGTCGADDNQGQAGHLIADYVPEIVAQAMSCKWSKGSSGPAGDEHHNLIAFTANDHGADASQTYPDQALRALRDAVGTKAYSEWCAGILAALRTPEILRSKVHGRSVRWARNDWNELGDDALSFPEDGASWPMFALWQSGGIGRAPRGWQPPEQLARELVAHLSKLPYQRASAARFLLGLWRASEGLGLLREALSALQEAWRPDGCEGQSAHNTWAVRRLTPVECERLMGFPDNWTDVPYRGKPATDGPRYKALGNSMAVPCMAWIGRRIQRVEELTAALVREAA